MKNLRIAENVSNTSWQSSQIQQTGIDTKTTNRNFQQTNSTILTFIFNPLSAMAPLRFH